MCPAGASGTLRARALLVRRVGEVAERSKALDWNSSNIFTGVRGFESHPLRQNWPRIGPELANTAVNGGSRRFLRDDKP